MTNAGRRDRAEAAFGHMQQAASEVIAAAHEALDLLDDVLTTADLGEMLDTVGGVSRAVARWGSARSAAAAQSAPPTSPDAEDRSRPARAVQRIAVR